MIPLTAGITVKGTAAIFAGRHRRAFSVFRWFEAEISGETTYVGALRFWERIDSRPTHKFLVFLFRQGRTLKPRVVLEDFKPPKAFIKNV